ncbi:MAG: hypothetical protein ABIP51_19210 [Bacteroidia bacterium]
MDDDKNIILLDYLSLKDYKTLNEKSIIFKEKISELIEKYKITEIIIEHFLMSFASGRTSKKVLILLAQWNGIVQYILFNEFPNVSVTLMNVRTARKRAVGVIPKGINGKEFVREFYMKKNLWEFPKNKKGNLIKEVEDMLDAVVLCYAK